MNELVIEWAEGWLALDYQAWSVLDLNLDILAVAHFSSEVIAALVLVGLAWHKLDHDRLAVDRSK